MGRLARETVHCSGGPVKLTNTILQCTAAIHDGAFEPAQPSAKPLAHVLTLADLLVVSAVHGDGDE